jgi:hypothetical protein
MRQILTITFLLYLSNTFGQNTTNYSIRTENPDLNKLFALLEIKNNSESLDSLFAIRKKLSDGQYFTFWDKQKKIKEFEFYLENGNVNGPFRHWNKNGILTTIGTYYFDSLWTFKKDYFLTSDTTFKIGTWRYYALQNQFDSTYNSAFIKQYNYKIPFDKDSIFYENWSYNNGCKWSERTFIKNDGLIKEIIYYKNGKKQIEFSNYHNFNLTLQWNKNDSLESIFVDNIFSIKIGDDKYYQKKNRIYGQINNSNGQVIKFLEFDDKKELRSEVTRSPDRKTWINIFWDENGNIEKIEYEKNGKLKTIK